MVLIVGSGLAAFSIGLELDRRGIEFNIIGDDLPSASHISSGIINPISGRELLLTPNYNNLLEAAIPFYVVNGTNFLKKVDIIKKIKDNNTIKDLELNIENKSEWISIISEDVVFIKKAYQLDVNSFLSTLKLYFTENGKFIKESFDYNLIELTEKVKYKRKEYNFVIFAEGMWIVKNIFFNHLPFLPNRGEALYLNVENFNKEEIYHDGKFICKYGDGYWIGSTFDRVPFSEPSKTENSFDSLSQAARKLTEGHNFQIVSHLGAFRCASHDRRPYIDVHPEFKQLYIFNGLGTKGVTYIPFYTHQIIDHILFQKPINKEVCIDRIKKNKIYRTV
jgi:glycine/D-amino acid oxidase-like deaminating enzyme